MDEGDEHQKNAIPANLQWMGALRMGLEGIVPITSQSIGVHNSNHIPAPSVAMLSDLGNNLPTTSNRNEHHSDFSVVPAKIRRAEPSIPTFDYNVANLAALNMQWYTWSNYFNFINNPVFQLPGFGDHCQNAQFGSSSHNPCFQQPGLFPEPSIPNSQICYTRPEMSNAEQPENAERSSVSHPSNTLKSRGNSPGFENDSVVDVQITEGFYSEKSEQGGMKIGENSVTMDPAEIARKINKFKMVSKLLGDRISASAERLSRKEKVRRGTNRIELRSKSLSSMNVPKYENLDRTVSCLNLADIEKYAESKATKVEIQFGEEAADKNGETLVLTKKNFDNELLEAQSLFNNKSNIDNGTKFEFLLSMMGKGNNMEIIDDNNKAQDFLKIVEKFQSASLIQYRGTPDENENNMKSAHIAMQPYFDLFHYKTQFFADAEEFLNSISRMRNNRHFDAFKLIDAYVITFKCHIVQLKTFFDNVTRQIFNPYALYHADETQSTVQINNLIIKFKRELKIVFNNIFNYGLVRNHITEIAHFSKMLKKIQHNQIAIQHAIMLINKTRIPEEFIPNDANFSWLNSSAPQNSIDILKFRVEDIFPENFNEDEFLGKAASYYFPAELIKNRIRKINATGPDSVKILLSALFGQSKSLFDSIAHFLPDGLDRRMVLYYQNQFFTHVWRLVYKNKLYISKYDLCNAPKVCNCILLSTITTLHVEGPALCDALKELDTFRSKLLEDYIAPPFIPPPCTSVVISIFDNTFCISTVFEYDLTSLKDRRLRSSKKIPSFEENIAKIVNFGKYSIILLIDFNSRILHGHWINVEKNEYITERFDIAFLPDSIDKDNVDWELIENLYIKNNVRINKEICGAEILSRLEILSFEEQTKKTTRKPDIFITNILLKLPNISPGSETMILKEKLDEEEGNSLVRQSSLPWLPERDEMPYRSLSKFREELFKFEGYEPEESVETSDDDETLSEIYANY